MRKIKLLVISAVLCTGCFTEMDEARETGRAYLLGRFDEQICELENIVVATPGIDYPTARMVQEVIPPRTKTGIELRTKYENPAAKIRLYGKKVEIPYTREGVEQWINAIEGNIARLKRKLELEVETMRRREEERIAREQAEREEARRREEERIAREQAEREEARRREEERIAREHAEREEARRREEERIAREKAEQEKALQEEIQKRTDEDGFVQVGYVKTDRCQRQCDFRLVVADLMPGDICLVDGPWAKELAVTGQWMERCYEAYAQAQEEEARRREEKALQEEIQKRTDEDGFVQVGYVKSGEFQQSCDIRLVVADLMPGDICLVDGLSAKELAVTGQWMERCYKAYAQAQEQAEYEETLRELQEEINEVNTAFADAYAKLKEIADGEQYEIKCRFGCTYRVYAQREIDGHPIRLDDVMYWDMPDYFYICKEEANPWRIVLKEGLSVRQIGRARQVWRTWKGCSYYRTRLSKYHRIVSEAKSAAAKEAEMKAEREESFRILQEEVERINSLLAETYVGLKEIADDDQYAIFTKRGNTYQDQARGGLERFRVNQMSLVEYHLTSNEVWHIAVKPDFADNYQSYHKSEISRFVKEFQEKCKELQDLVNEAKTVVAEKKARAATAQTRLASFAEAEKYPMAAARPSPPAFMKDITAGLSQEWVETYLTANGIDFSVDNRNTALVNISAKINERVVRLGFKEKVLCSITINLPKTVTPDALKSKYGDGKELNVKVTASEPSIDVAFLDSMENGVVPFRKEVHVSFVVGSGLLVEADYEEFAGLVWINGIGALELIDADALLGLRLDKKSRADVVLDADGNLIKCNSNLGRELLPLLRKAAERFKAHYKAEISRVVLTDPVLMKRCEELQNLAEKARIRAEEAAKKEADANTLDF